MASALQNVSALGNPNDRRRINLVARYVMKGLGNVEDTVKLWNKEKGLPANERTISRTAMYGKAKSRGAGFKAFLAGTVDADGRPKKAGELAKTSDERKNEYARVKRQVANAFAASDELAYGEGYADRALGSHASRYLKKSKKVRLEKTTSRTTPNVFGKVPKGGAFAIPVFKGKGVKGGSKSRSRQVVNAKGVREWDATRLGRRMAGEWGHTLPPGVEDWLIERKRFARGQKVKFSSRYENVRGPSGKMNYKLRSGQVPFREMAVAPVDRRAEKAHRAAFAAMARKGGIPKGYSFKGGKSRSKFPNLEAAVAAGEYGYVKPNPGSALMNPTYDSVVPFVTEYAVPVAVVGAVAGGVHFAAQKFGVTEKITSGLEMIPVVGAPIAQYAPFTVQGLVAGSLLAIGASFAGGAAGKYLAMAAGGAIAFGGGIDAFNYLSGAAGGDDATGDLAFGDLAFTNTSALGDLAFTNTGDLGDLAFGAANPGFKVASLSAEDYAQSSLGDALYSGADFSGVEGQALVNGKATFVSRFGRAPVRAAGRIANQASHLSGREGHRWGWLIKMIGWERAQKLASLPPRQRLALLAKLRKAAIAAFQQSVALDLAAQAAATQQLSSGANAADVARAHELAQAEAAGIPGSASDLGLPAAGQVLSGAGGAVGAASANGSELAGMDYLGDPTLFMGA